MMTAEEYSESLIEQLKQRRYKKNKLTWYKQVSGVTVVFNIQKSIYSKDDWYYNLGISINSIHQKPVRTISHCDMIYRIEQRVQGKWVTQNSLIRILDKWVEKYGDIELMHIHAISGSLPAPITNNALSFLTTIVF